MASEMSQETAQLLFRDGALLVFLDVPEGTEFGIDYNIWQVGPMFQGVKMIPPGIHFVYYSAVSKRGQSAPRMGFFHDFKRKEILVKTWDRYNEDIKCETVTDEDLEHFRLNKEELDRYLGAYPYENLIGDVGASKFQAYPGTLKRKVPCHSIHHYKKWVSLTNHMTSSLTDRLQPQCGRISAVAQFISEGSDSQSRRCASEEIPVNDTPCTSMEEALLRLPKMKHKPGTVIRFSQFPKHNYPVGSSPAEITEHSMDSSFTLTSMLSTCYQGEQNEILGELQFTFVCFLIGQVYDAFEQWKKLVHLLCSSASALVTHRDLFVQFISMLHFQLKEIPEDFFVDIVSQVNFLTITLQEFFANLEGSEVDDKLRRRGLKFRDHLTHKFHWDFTSEPDDYAPVVVDICEYNQQKEAAEVKTVTD